MILNEDIMKGREISCRSSRVDRRLSPLGTKPHPLHRLLAHDDDDDDDDDNDDDGDVSYLAF